jgi:YebC/PmpR family DNA-binding regulatory protein
VQKARDASMPKDNIQRAIDRGTGAGADAGLIEHVQFEGYGPGGTAVLVDSLTDNRNRTTADVRFAFGKYGGHLGEPGSVSYIFEKRGVIVVDGERFSEDDLMPAIDAGAEDVQADGDILRVISDPSDLTAVRAAVEGAGVEVISSSVTMEPTTTVEIDESHAGSLLKLIDELEEHDDVQEVHANFDISDEIMERALA